MRIAWFNKRVIVSKSFKWLGVVTMIGDHVVVH